MIDTEKNLKIRELIDNAKNIAIMPSKVAVADGFAAAAGLYLILKQADKPVSFLYTGKKPEECEGLLKDEEILSDISARELIVEIDYSNTPASKVHYNTENDILFLSISPISKDFDLKRIKSTIKGFNFDLIITVGAQSLEDFGQLHTELSEEFKNSAILNFDNTSTNTNFGKTNVVDTTESSLSLLILNKSVGLGFTVDARSAKALLTGISYRNVNL